jgi:hypothetical protein
LLASDIAFSLLKPGILARTACSFTGVYFAILAIALFNLFMASEAALIISHKAFPET